ncbi:hypothetical protein BpHYR1_030776 [Brachionus plicatilis]|uniref:Uncharacterized protein n=1 Tax=Brachionus plicatilis TaxID=10195 RepID=A0A3M7RJN5_BRAPC|nr:hypothetical protein BpHYR1_030776 [Brachionus plicatilis]
MFVYFSAQGHFFADLGAHRTSFLTAVTLAPVLNEPMFSIKISPFSNFCTLAAFLSPSVLTPSKRLSKNELISMSEKICGSESIVPSAWPTIRSALHSSGSILVPTPIKPPGTAYCRSFCSAYKLKIFDLMGLQLNFPCASFVTTPGRTSISWPTVNTPRIMLPPATPPFRSSTSQPGLFTSKDRMIINFGLLVKSLSGMGTFLTRYSHTASMLYFSWADMGRMGASSAMVPWTNFFICSCCSLAWVCLTRSTLF